MKRLREVLSGCLLVVLAATPALAQDIKPAGPGSVEFTTKTGINFKFGVSLDFQPMFVKDLDFNDDTNFQTLTEFGTFGENDSIIGVESRLFFTATKGRVSLYTALEMDGVLDERVIDTNLLNVERINLSLLVPEVSSTFTVGGDIYVLDGIGGLVYIDDDPGIWVKGGAGPYSWQAAWHKRLEFGGAGTGGVAQTNRVSLFEDREDDINLFSAKVGYDATLPAGRFHLEPFFLAYLRDSPGRGAGLTRLNLVGPNGRTRPGTVTTAAKVSVDPVTGAVTGSPDVVEPGSDPLQGSIADIQPNQESFYIGVAGTGNFGIIRPSAEFVYFGGTVSGLVRRKATVTPTACPTGGAPNVTPFCPFGFEEFDIQSWAWYGRLDLDLSKEPWWPLRGIIPFVSVEWLRGDDDPNDNDLEGFVSPSAPTGLRRGDLPLLRKTVLGIGSPIIGDGSADFGFEVTGRGTGPTIGNIFEGGTFDSKSVFNNRFGKGDNPGYIKISGGLQGSWDPKWAFHLIGTYLQYHHTQPIEAEFGAFGVTDVDESIGGGLDLMVVYKPQPQYQFRPFFSVFFPGSGVEDIAGADDTAVFSGVNFRAMF